MQGTQRIAVVGPPAGSSEISSIENSTTDRLHPIRVPAWVRAGFRVAGSLAPGAAAKVGTRLFFTPTRAPLRPEERAVLARGESFSLSVGGQQVAGHAWGEGPAVLLAHGWGGHSGQMTPLVDPLVGAGFRAVTIDLPGHGESGGRRSSLVHFASALAAAAALWKPLDGIAAHSLGAAACTLAMSRGLAARRAVFFAPAARFDSVWSRFRSGTGISDAVWRRMMREAESWLEVRFDGLAPVQLAPRMSAPLLVFHDAGDREMRFEEGAELVRSWPGARLRRTERLGHLRLLRDEQCIREAVEFLAG